MPGWFNRAGLPIGIDVGSQSIRMLQLAPRGKGWSAIAAAVRPVPADLPTDAQPRRQALAALLHEMLNAAPFAGRRAISCLPATLLQYKSLRVPQMPPDEVAKAVEFEAADRMDLGAQCQVQFFNAGEVRQGGEIRQEIVVMAAPTALVENHVQALVDAGLEPEVIDAMPSAMARYTVIEGKTGPDAPAVIVVDLGDSSSKVLIARNGRVVFFKMIDVGGRDLDRVVASHFNISTQDAAKARRQLDAGDSQAAAALEQRAPSEAHGFQSVGVVSDGAASVGVVSDGAASVGAASVGAASVGVASDGADSAAGAGPSASEVLDAMRDTLNELGREIGLCLRYYSVTFRGGRPETARLIGGAANQPKVVEALAQSMGVNLESFDPLSDVDVSAVRDVIDAGGHPGAWAIAASLARRGGAPKLNRGAA